MIFYFLLFALAAADTILYQRTESAIAEDHTCVQVGRYEFCYGPDYGNIAQYELDQIVNVYACQENLPWHLADISYNVTTYSNPPPKKIPTVYVLDTLIDVEHPEFEGRASVGFSLYHGMHYHGTHVAGLIAGKTYGVCKSCLLRGVQVLDANGYGSYTGIIQGISWVSKQKPGVVNYSIGGPKSGVINKALDELVELGFTVIAAAGNDFKDACKFSPGSAHNIFMVGAYDIERVFAKFSNYGKCVDILAPGVDIPSAVPNGQYATLSGTSMASPIVAGTAAVYLSQHNEEISPRQVISWLLYKARNGIVARLPPKTTERSVLQTLFNKQCKNIKGTTQIYFQNIY